MTRESVCDERVQLEIIAPRFPVMVQDLMITRFVFSHEIVYCVGNQPCFRFC